MPLNETQIAIDELQAHVRMLQSRCIGLAMDVAKLRAELEAERAGKKEPEMRIVQ
jgi:outer membrane murein-binding lipoprotein Lpp